MHPGPWQPGLQDTREEGAEHRCRPGWAGPAPHPHPHPGDSIGWLLGEACPRPPRTEAQPPQKMRCPPPASGAPTAQSQDMGTGWLRCAQLPCPR